MNGFIRDILTGTSNISYEISRVLALLGVLAFIIYSGCHLFINKTFEPMAFGTGFGAILLGAGFGTAAKDKANPANQGATVTTMTATTVTPGETT